jgi:hypothetical protein
MPFAILISVCKLIPLVVCFDAAWALSKVQYHTKQTGGTPRSGRARTQLCWNVASTKFSAIASFRTGAGFDSSTKTFADILLGKGAKWDCLDTLGLRGWRHCHLIHFEGPDNELTVLRHYTFDIIVQSWRLLNMHQPVVI